jgi:hypothetical protein
MIFLAPGAFGRGGDLERLAVDVRAAVPARHPADWNLGSVARRVPRARGPRRGTAEPDQDGDAPAHDRIQLGLGTKMKKYAQAGHQHCGMAVYQQFMGWRCVYAQACLEFGSVARIPIKIMRVIFETKEKHDDAVWFSS